VIRSLENGRKLDIAAYEAYWIGIGKAFAAFMGDGGIKDIIFRVFLVMCYSNMRFLAG